MNRLFFGVIVLLFSINVLANDKTPYQGQQHRSIKALSKEQVEGYLSGKGMGYAKTAELNHYPGPKHVLELAGKLSLSDTQIRQTKFIMSKMKAKAVRYGKQLVKLEAELDRKFASGSINALEMQKLLNEIGQVEAKVRNTHLSAHVEQAALMSREQIRLYDELRGYTTMNSSSHAHKEHNH